MRGMWVFVIAGLASPPQMRIVVNIPAYRLEAYVDDSLARTSRIAPGMPRYRTPRGEFAITSIQWNPWWIPPDSPWARKEKPMPPGPANPMGRVKLNFQPLYFIHATPFENSIGSAASHGCVRMKTVDAIELARLVHRFGTPSVSAEEIERFVADTMTTNMMSLEDPVTIEIRYDLVEVRGGRVAVYRDIYGLATHSLRDAVYAALDSSGVDTLRVDPQRIRDLVRRVPQAGRSATVDSLLRPGELAVGAFPQPSTVAPGRDANVRKSLAPFHPFPDIRNSATVRNSTRGDSMNRGC